MIFHLRQISAAFTELLTLKLSLERQSEYQAERFKALPCHSTPQTISCDFCLRKNPAILYAIWT